MIEEIFKCELGFLSKGAEYPREGGKGEIPFYVIN